MNSKPGVLRRGLAWLLDISFLSFFFFPITCLYSGKLIMGPKQHLWGITDPICLVFLFIIFTYLILMEAYVGWTVGKRMVGMRVVDRNGNKIGFSKSVIRNMLRLVDGLPAFNILGIFLIAAGQPTLWMGVIERESVYAPMIWVLVLAIVLLRAHGTESHRFQVNENIGNIWLKELKAK